MACRTRFSVRTQRTVRKLSRNELAIRRGGSTRTFHPSRGEIFALPGRLRRGFATSQSFFAQGLHGLKFLRSTVQQLGLDAEDAENQRDRRPGKIKQELAVIDDTPREIL